jgi:NitT/TauT family transport system permease protein
MAHSNTYVFLKDLRKITVLRRPISTLTRNFFFLIAIFLLSIGYTCFAYQAENKMIPHWDALFVGVQNLYHDSRSGDYILFEDTIASMKRLLLAVLLASTVGITIGLYMGVYAAAESLFARIIEFIGNVPPNAMMVVFLTIFGFTFEMYLAVIIFGIIAMITKGAYLAAKSVSDEHIFGAKTLGASNQEVVWSVLFPMLRPQLIETVRQSMAPAIIFLIGAEWVAGTDGFGHRFMQLYRSARMDVMFPYLIYLGFMGIMTSIAFKLIQRVLCPWYSEENK